MNEVRLFLASSIVEFEQERIAIGAFVERLIQAYRKDGLYFRLYRCEDETFAFTAAGAQGYLNELVEKSDYVMVLLGEAIGEKTLEEIRHACESGAHTLFFVRSDSRTAVSNPYQVVLEGITAASGSDLLASVCQQDCFAFSHPSEVCGHLLHEMVEGGYVVAPEWMPAYDGGRWLSHGGYALIPEAEIAAQGYWNECAEACASLACPTVGTNRVFVVTAPDGVEDGDDMLNFVRTLNDIYRKLGIDFEAFAFTSDRLDPNATDENAAASKLFLILGRKNGNNESREMLEGAIEAYREHLDVDGDGFPKILTFFEDVEPLPQVLAAMREHLSDIDHYYSLFENIDSVKFLVAVELARMLATHDLFFRGGRLCAKGGPLDIDVTKIPIFGNHPELKESIRELEEIERQIGESSLESGEKNGELEHKLIMLLNAVNSIENDVLGIASRVSEMWDGGDLHVLDERQRERTLLVKSLFDQGEYDKVVDILMDEGIDDEANAALFDYEKSKRGMKRGKKRGAYFVNLKLLLVSAIKQRGIRDDDMDVITAAYERCIELADSFDLGFDFVEHYVQLLWHRERREEAKDVCHRVLGSFDRRIAEGEKPRTFRLERARVMRQLADVLDNAEDERALAVEYGEKALRTQLREIGDLEDEGERDEEIEVECARTKNSLGVYNTHLKNHEIALGYHLDALETFEYWEKNGTKGYKEVLGKTYNNIAVALDNLGRFDESLAYHEKSLATRRADDGVGPVDHEHYIANSLNALATRYFKLAGGQKGSGDTPAALKSYAKAEEIHREALAIRQRYEGDNREQFAPRLAASRHNLAGCIMRQVELDATLAPEAKRERLLEARDLLELASEVRDEFARSDPGMYSSVAADSKAALKRCDGLLENLA